MYRQYDSITIILTTARLLLIATVHLKLQAVGRLGHDFPVGCETTCTRVGCEAKSEKCGTCTTCKIPTNNPELAPANPLTAWINSGILHIAGLTVGETVSIYSVNGALVHQSVVSSEEMEIALSVQGVYIVQSGGNTIRVVFSQ